MRYSEYLNNLREQTLKDYVEIAKISEDNERAIANIILMEKEARGLTYTDLAEMLNRFNSIFSKICGGALPSIAEKIKLNLQNKKPDMELVKDLCEVLEIEDTLEQRIAAYRYKRTNERQSGRVSETKKKENQSNYEEIQNDINSPEGVLIEEAMIEGLKDIFFDGEWRELDVYYALVEEHEEMKKLKKLLLINDQFPKDVDKFLENFTPDEYDIADMEKMKIEITR